MMGYALAQNVMSIGGEKMGIMLGNLSLKQIQERCGMTFQDEFIAYLKKTYEPNADVQGGTEKWHGFVLPFCIG